MSEEKMKKNRDSITSTESIENDYFYNEPSEEEWRLFEEQFIEELQLGFENEERAKTNLRKILDFEKKVKRSNPINEPLDSIINRLPLYNRADDIFQTDFENELDVIFTKSEVNIRINQVEVDSQGIQLDSKTIKTDINALLPAVLRKLLSIKEKHIEKSTGKAAGVEKEKNIVSDINIIETTIIYWIDNPILFSPAYYQMMIKNFLVLRIGPNYDQSLYNAQYPGEYTHSPEDLYRPFRELKWADKLENAIKKKEDDVYLIASLMDLLDACIVNLLQSKRRIRLCQVCDRLFVTQTDNRDTICRIPNPELNGKTCWSVRKSKQTSAYKNKDELTQKHNRIYERRRQRFGAEDERTSTFTYEAGMLREKYEKYPTKENKKRYEEYLDAEDKRYRGKL